MALDELAVCMRGMPRDGLILVRLPNGCLAQLDHVTATYVRGAREPGAGHGCVMGEIYVFHDPDSKPEEWRVEEIDSDGDGGIDMAIFSGPHAEQRAKRFAEQLRSQSRPN